MSMTLLQEGFLSASQFFVGILRLFFWLLFRLDILIWLLRNLEWVSRFNNNIFIILLNQNLLKSLRRITQFLGFICFWRWKIKSSRSNTQTPYTRSYSESMRLLKHVSYLILLILIEDLWSHFTKLIWLFMMSLTHFYTLRIVAWIEIRVRIPIIWSVKNINIMQGTIKFLDNCDFLVLKSDWVFAHNL